jgi:arylsulfatase A-like enzyme
MRFTPNKGTILHMLTSISLKWRWAAAIFYTVLIFTFAWYVPLFWDFLTQNQGTENAGILVDRVSPILLVLVLVGSLFFFKITKLSSYCWLSLSALGYIYLLTLHAEYPVERIHLIQYSLVAWFYYFALSPSISRPKAMAGAWLILLLIGGTDEWIQHQFIDNRSGTWGDVTLNWVAGSLGLVALVAVLQPKMPSLLKRRPALFGRSLVYVLPLACTAFLSHQVYTRYINPPLNLIFITFDCARADRMGFNGYHRDTTKWMDDQLGNTAIFSNMFSQAAWTSPGVNACLTGLYPPTHGVTAAGETLPKTVYTLLDAFQERGYKIPKMSYLTVDPNFQNFAEMEDTGYDITKTNEIAQINRWIGENHREPFAMWYHWRFAHLPYDPPKDKRHYPPANDLDSPMPAIINSLVNKEVIIPLASNVEWDYDLHKPWIDALYDAQINHFDDAFESIRYKLGLHHILDNTIIIVTADHGEELLEHGHVGHGSTAVHSRHYDELLHIPLYIFAPKKIKQKRVIDTIAQQVDILPTVFDMMDWEIPEEVQGRSLWPAIQGEPMEDVPTFAESIEGGYQSKPDQRSTFVRSVRTKEWKFIMRTSPQGDSFELFNLTTDPGELNNVHESEPEVGNDLLGVLTKWISDNLEARLALEEREALQEARIAAMDPANLSIPEVLVPSDGDTIFYETMDGSIAAEWTGNPHAAYIIEYDIGESWHRLKGKYPVEMGTKQIFGPIPKDGWKPLYQWNPYRLRIRPRDLKDGWSDWITIQVAPIAK